MKGGYEENLGGLSSGSEEPNPSYDEGMVEMEIDAARALADMAVVGPTSRTDSLSFAAHREDETENNEVVAVSGAKKQGDMTGTLTGQFPFGRRGKQVLTEAEREAKRLRRVLANRESARQTILRRQALREELAKKVAVLSSENQNVKKEKEKATNEYLSLKETNRQLKEQLVKVATQESTSELKQKTQIDPTATRFSLTMYSGPPLVPPYIWGPWSPHAQKYTKIDPNAADYMKNEPSTSQRALPLGLSCYAPLYQLNQAEIPSSRVMRSTNEAQQMLPTVDETDISCSLTLGLETGSKTRHNVTETPKAEKEDVPGGIKRSDCMKVAAEARKRRKEITRLKQMQRRL